MKRRAVIVYLCLSIVSLLGAQAARVRLTLGLAYAGYREETYSTILQRLETTRWGVDLDLGDSTIVHRLSAGFAMGRTHSSVSDTATIGRYYDVYSGEPVVVALSSPIRAIKGHLSYGLAFRVVDADPYEGYVGGFVRLDGLVQIANYPSVSFIAALGPQYRQRLRVSPIDEVELDIASPLVAYAVRPPYAGADAALMQMAARNPLALFTTGSLLSLGRHQGVLLDAAYLHTVTPGLELVNVLSATLMRTAFPLPRADAELAIRSGVGIGL